MEAVTLEELFLIIQKQNEEIKRLTESVNALSNRLKDMERELTKATSPWVRGWQGVADYTLQARSSAVSNIELKEALTPFKLTGKTVLFRKDEIDEFIEGTAVK